MLFLLGNNFTVEKSKASEASLTLEFPVPNVILGGEQVFLSHSWAGGRENQNTTATLRCRSKSFLMRRDEVVFI